MLAGFGLPLAAGGATCWPPVGSAPRSNGRCALPHPSAPQGAQRCAASAAALCSRHGQSAQPVADRSVRRWCSVAADCPRPRLGCQATSGESGGEAPDTPAEERSTALRVRWVAVLGLQPCGLPRPARGAHLQLWRRVGPGNFTPSPSQNRTGRSRVIRLVPPVESCRLPSSIGVPPVTS